MVGQIYRHHIRPIPYVLLSSLWDSLYVQLLPL